MKNKLFITAICCIVLMLASTVSAKETLIVKQNKTVYYFQLENYRDVNMYVLADVLVNPTIADLVILEAPKSSWDIINRVEDGVYFSYKDKQDDQIKSLREENTELKKYKAKIEQRKQTNSRTAIWIGVIICFIGSILILFRNKLVEYPKIKKPRKKIFKAEN
ncbi:MAG: hypothetical protein ACOYL8_01725 [Patescibacteria group bacterium]